MTREQARAEINSRISELPKAKKRVGGRDTYICPFCNNGSGSDGDGISTKDGIHYKCFKCGFSGDYLAMLKQQHGTDNERDIFNFYRLDVDGSSSTPPRRSAAVDFVGAANEQAQSQGENAPMVDYTAFFNQASAELQASPEALSYLKGRGISPDTATRFMLGYDSAWRSPKAIREGKHPPTSARIIIPTSNHSYLARAIDKDAAPAYKAMKEGAAELFNKIALQGDVPVFVVEGEIDALSIIEIGGEALALGSTSNVNKLLALCKATPPAVPLVLSLDNDEPGKRRRSRYTVSTQD